MYVFKLRAPLLRRQEAVHGRDVRGVEASRPILLLLLLLLLIIIIIVIIIIIIINIIIIIFIFVITYNLMIIRSNSHNHNNNDNIDSNNNDNNIPTKTIPTIDSLTQALREMPHGPGNSTA